METWSPSWGHQDPSLIPSAASQQPSRRSTPPPSQGNRRQPRRMRDSRTSPGGPNTVLRMFSGADLHKRCNHPGPSMAAGGPKISS
ncbi:unnamed protein product [Arctogadus glacialis]